VADGLYASAPFLHAAGALGLRAVVRLKENVPTLLAAAQARFTAQRPTLTIDDHGDRVDLWDADDFDPWEGLAWPTVRVLRYRQHHRDGTVVEAYWLTDFSPRRLSTRTLYRIAKGRWTIENQGFNDAKTRYGFAHVPHHQGNSLLAHWLLVALTLVIERLFRLRYLHRGTTPLLAPIDLLRRLRLALAPAAANTRRPAPRSSPPGPRPRLASWPLPRPRKLSPQSLAPSRSPPLSRPPTSRTTAGPSYAAVPTPRSERAVLPRQRLTIGR